MNWIYCKHELPKDNEEVLVIDETFGYLVAKYDKSINAYGELENAFRVHYSLMSDKEAKLPHVIAWTHISKLEDKVESFKLEET